ncbi:MAG: hypothetical protein AAGG50_18635 [Bacteroidota bacterium]
MKRAIPDTVAFLPGDDYIGGGPLVFSLSSLFTYDPARLPTYTVLAERGLFNAAIETDFLTLIPTALGTDQVRIAASDETGREVAISFEVETKDPCLLPPPPDGWSDYFPLPEVGDRWSFSRTYSARSSELDERGHLDWSVVSKTCHAGIRIQYGVVSNWTGYTCGTPNWPACPIDRDGTYGEGWNRVSGSDLFSVSFYENAVSFTNAETHLFALPLEGNGPLARFYPDGTPASVSYSGGDMLTSVVLERGRGIEELTTADPVGRWNETLTPLDAP